MSNSIFARKINPIYQAIIVLLVGLIFLGIGILGEKIGILKEDKLFPWTIMTTMILAFAIFNCIFSFAYLNQGKYLLLSIFGFMLVLVLGGLIAYLVSGISIDDAKSFRWIYFMISVCYLIFLSIVITMRFIFKIAQDQDARLRNEVPDQNP